MLYVFKCIGLVHHMAKENLQAPILLGEEGFTYVMQYHMGYMGYYSCV